jgi:class 3 adenylate cyclase/predicted ATPase
MRPVTALFADVVGSTALGERLGADEVKALIGECVSQMSRAVEEFGGTIQAYMGDGICAYFGVPAAHEDDPERAARAGLRILDMVREYARDIEQAWSITDFNVRVGINSGQTAVGTVGGADPQTVALGDATNVAARLQSAAAPGTIAVGEVTARRLGPRFVVEPIGDLTVKGRSGTIRASQLVGPRPATEAPAPTPIVGREGELERLRAVLGELQAGRGQVLLLVGEAGVGKSRLLGELRRMAEGHVTWLEGHCVSYQREFMSRPFIEMLRTWIGAEEDEPELAVRTKLRARLAALFQGTPDDLLPYLGRMLSVRLDPHTEGALAQLSVDELSARIRAACTAWVERLAADRPLILALDGMQWAYASSRELAEDLLEVTDRTPLLLAVTMRPDPGSEAWPFRLRVMTDYSHRAVEIQLGTLSEAVGLQLVDALLPAGMLPDEAKRGVVGRSEGNPLYIEELLQALVASGGLDRRRTWSLGADPTSLLPPALESLFVARIDRLPPGPRRLAQVAAVVGRTFSVRVLERVAQTEDLQAELGALLRADVVRELRRYPDLECTFKHGLLQEAALATLTPGHLRDLYGRVGRAFEELFAETIEDRLEALAFYYYRSDDQAKALEYLVRAARKAESVTLLQQAAELWARARKVASALGDAAAERHAAERLDALERG